MIEGGSGMLEKYRHAHVQLKAEKREQEGVASLRRTLQTDVILSDNSWKLIADMHSAAEKQEAFFLNGYVDTFIMPQIAPYACENLFTLTGCTVFHLDEQSYIYTRSSLTEENIILVCTLRGRGILEYKGKKMAIETGKGFIVCEEEPVCYRSGHGGWEYVLVGIRGPLYHDFYGLCEKNYGPVFRISPEEQFLKDLYAILDVYSRPIRFRDWIASARINDMLAHLISWFEEDVEGEATAAAAMVKLIRYIEEHFSEDLSIDHLCRYSNISRAHLFRLFNTYTGFPPNEYVIRTRLDHAKQLLMTSSRPIAEIAEECGCSDVNNFRNLFKKREGMTPDRFRRNHR